MIDPAHLGRTFGPYTVTVQREQIRRFAETLGLPESPYEPMGPAFLPRALSVFIGIFALLLLAKTIISSFKTTGQLSLSETSNQLNDYIKHPIVAFLSMIMTLLYITSMQYGLLGFRSATVLFILFSGGLLTRMKLKSIPLFITIACIMGLGGHYIFTKVFTVDLP